jgi:hypothetical protein
MVPLTFYQYRGSLAQFQDLIHHQRQYQVQAATAAGGIIALVLAMAVQLATAKMLTAATAQRIKVKLNCNSQFLVSTRFLAARTLSGHAAYSSNNRSMNLMMTGDNGLLLLN